MSKTPAVKVTVRADPAVRVTVRVTTTPARDRRPPPLAVRLPNIATVPDPWRGATYVLRGLISAGDDNPKLKKSNDAGTPYKTWGLALAPARESGTQLCASATPGCRAACLYHQGHARLDPAIAACRIARSVAWKKHRLWFETQLLWELEAVRRRAEANGFMVAVRLNLTSDVAWEREWPALFEQFTEFKWYDYTKHYARMMRFVAGGGPANYSLTFSRSETNHDEALAVLRAGGNVAVVFRRSLPAVWEGRTVIEGDEHDLRFLDPAGVVVGLRAKGTGKLDASGFVVDAGPERFGLHVV